MEKSSTRDLKEHRRELGSLGVEVGKGTAETRFLLVVFQLDLPE